MCCSCCDLNYNSFIIQPKASHDEWAIQFPTHANEVVMSAMEVKRVKVPH
jgi:hypothetical protein